MRSLSITPALALAAALLLSLSVGLGSRAGAQPAPPTPPPISVKGGNATLAVTNASANVALPSSTLTFPVVQLINDGNTEIFYNFGTTSGAAATTSNAPLPAGASVALFAGTNGWVAAITASSTSTLRVVQWNGAPVYARSGGSAGGGFTVGGPVTGGSSGCNLFITSTNTVGCIATLTENDSGSVFTLPGNLALPDTGSAGAAGVVTYGGARFLHDQNANSNVFLGHNAYNFTGTPTTSVCIGESCMLSAASGSGNTCVGRFCMGSALTGSGNSGLGNGVFPGLTGGGTNTAMGQSAGTGITSSSNTTCLGASSCGANAGSGTIAIGFSSGALVTGANDVLIGGSVAPNLAGGANDIIIGAATGGGITSGSGNTIVATNCNSLASGLTSAIILGNNTCAAMLSFGTPTSGVWTFLGGTIAAPLLTDATHTDATVCRDTTSGQFFFGSGTGGICLGTSGRQFKRDIFPADDVTLEQIIQLKPSRYFNREDSGLDPSRPQVGLIADEVRAVLPDCADDKTVDYLCVSVMSLNAIKQLAAEVAELKRQVGQRDLGLGRPIPAGGSRPFLHPIHSVN